MNKSLEEIAHIFSGTDYKKNPPGDSVPIYGTGGIIGFTSIPLQKGPALLSGRKGSINNPIYVEGDFWNVDTIFCIKAKEGISTKWLFYNFLNTDLSRLNEATGVPSISSIALYKLKFKWVEFNVQTRIAGILTTCDFVIEKTQSAIAKYKSIKQGMLQDLFTRGIDIKTGKLRPKYEDAPELYKTSSFGWIPKEWVIETLGNKSYFELKTGGTPSTFIKEYWGGEIRWMSSGEVNKKRIYEVDGRITNLGMQNSNAVYFPIYSVVIGLAGQGKTRATVAITYVETTSNQSIAAIIFDLNKVNPFFYYHLLDFQYERLRSASAGAGRAGLSLHILGNYSVQLPPLAEQNIISEKLESIDALIQTEEAYLLNLRAVKQGLMGDLLSGKKKIEIITDSN